LSASLKPEELLTLDADTILRRLYWEEQVLRFEPALSDPVPRFVCVCSRERVQRMIQNLGLPEAQSILDERGNTGLTKSTHAKSSSMPWRCRRFQASCNSGLCESNRYEKYSDMPI
jgi:hypothetical protein